MPVISGVAGGGDGSGATVQFVDGISASPTVRLDLNDLEPYLTVTLDVSPPPLRRAMSETMLADGDFISSTAFSNRTLALKLELATGTAYDAAGAAVALSALAVELNRPSNFLMVALGETPTFYRTYRSPDFALEMLDDNVDYSSQTINIMAEPFGLGLREVISSYGVLTNDPQPPAGPGSTQPGRCFDVNNVLGDVETPPQIILSVPTAGGSTVIAVRRRGTPSALVHVTQAETMAMGTDTGVATSNDPAMSGSGNNYAHVAFATSGALVNRAGWQFPAAASTDARGSYRLFVRARTSGAYGDILTLAGTYNGVPLVTLPPGVPRELPADGAGGCYLVDLGTFHVPQGNDPTYDGFSGQEMPVAPGAIWVQAGRVSGAGNVDIDYAYLVPADDTYTQITWDPSVTSGTVVRVVDGPSDSVYAATGSPYTPPLTIVPANDVFTGALPMLSPGNNRVYVLDAINTAESIAGAGMLVEVSYWPRYLTLATA